MRYSLPVRAGASVTDAYSAVLNMDNYYNAAGTGTNALKVEWATAYRDGSITSIILQHSTDAAFTSPETLWDLSTTDSAVPQKVFYAWKQYLRVKYTYVTGTSTEDAGLRFKFTLEPFGQPGWSGVTLFRSEHTDAIMPILTDISRGFLGGWTKQADAAKRTIYTTLCAKGIDPDKLTTDGHMALPVVEHLAMAGAALCLYYALLGSNVVRSEVYDKNLAALWERYNDFLTTATEGNVLNQDTGDAKPDPSEVVFRPARVIV